MTRTEWPALTLKVSSERPQTVAALLEYKEECRTAGRFLEAQDIQVQLELLKYQEDHRILQQLWEQHMEQAQALKAEQDADWEAFVSDWTTRMDDFRQRGDEQIAVLDKRHADELAEFRAKMLMPKPRWSPLLLNIRRSREALVLQNDFSKAEQLREWAEKLEREETQAQMEQWQHKSHLEEVRLTDKQIRESDAMLKKLSLTEHEAFIAQERQFDKLLKKHQAAEAALQATQALELAEMTQALKGWMNPRKPGIHSTPVSPSASGASTPYVRRSAPSVPSKALTPTPLGRSFRPMTSYELKKVAPPMLRPGLLEDHLQAVFNGGLRAREWLGTMSPDSVSNMYDSSPLINPLLPKRRGLATTDGHRTGNVENAVSCSPRGSTVESVYTGDLPPYDPVPLNSQYCLTSAAVPVLPIGANGKPPAVMGVPYAAGGTGPGSAALRAAAKAADQNTKEPVPPFGRHLLHA